MNWWEAVLLGLVQGITEWLPISSSGHLAITRQLLGLEPSTFYDLILHIGTLIVVLWVFRLRVSAIALALLTLPKDAGRMGWKQAASTPTRRLAWMVALASAPIAVGGFVFAARIEEAFASMRVVGVSLLFTGVILWSTRKLAGSLGESDITSRRALWIGVWQMMAVLPGISRSGSTIAAGMHAGLDRRTAADFGFLLAIPALVGATLFKALDADASAWMERELWIGFAASAVVGYATLRWLLAFIKARGLHPFAWYCWGVGAVVLASAL